MCESPPFATARKLACNSQLIPNRGRRRQPDSQLQSSKESGAYPNSNAETLFLDHTHYLHLCNLHPYHRNSFWEMGFTDGVWVPTVTRKQQFMTASAEPILNVIVEALVTSKPTEDLPRFVCKLLDQDIVLGPSTTHTSVDSVEALSYCKRFVDPLLEVRTL